MTHDEDYFRYLLQRSRIGSWYRRFWLYPKLTRFLRGSVLDVGCGIGDFLAFRPGSVGVDINSYAIDWCVRRGLDARLMRGDGLPVEDAVFQSVILDNVLEHIEKPQKLLKEIRRVLQSNGSLLVGVPGKLGYDHDPDHKIYYDKNALVSTLGFAGFKLETTFWTPFHSAWLESHMRQYCLYGVFTLG